MKPAIRNIAPDAKPETALRGGGEFLRIVSLEEI
jgi:hypothetical protein